MSRTGSISIEYYERPSTLDLLDALLGAGWTTGGVIGHLPVGDDGAFDWEHAPLDDWPGVRSVLAEKEARGELIGVGLRWAGTLGGADFLFYSEGPLRLVLDAERPRIPGAERFTDMTWFLARVLPPLLGAGCVISKIDCSDFE